MASPPSIPLNVVGSDTPFDSVTSSVTPPSPPRSSPLLQSISPSILIIVTVLAVTVIVSLLLCFLLRHLNRRCLRRLATSPSAVSTPIFTSSRRISPEIPLPSSASATASASASVIESLPLFAFSAVSRSSAAADCAVCLSKFHRDDLLRLLPLCCHAFHAECIDTWLRSNLSCPLCRSAIFASDSDLAKVLRSSDAAAAAASDSFRIEIGNVSQRGIGTGTGAPDSAASGDARGGDSRSYSIGSFEYLVEEDSEIPFSHTHHRRNVSEQKDFPVTAESTAAQPVPSHEANLAGEVAGVRSWLKDYVDRVSASISSRTGSFRSSGRFFSGGGSSRRSDVVPIDAEYDVDGNRIGEEISEMFRWLSGV